jgi:hypothetical protein
MGIRRRKDAKKFSSCSSDTDDQRALPRVSLLQDAGASPLRDDESASGHPHLGTALQVLL